jgi:cytochrome oxidase assembly protein ShyY1
VTVTGWVRQDASGDSTHVSDQSTRSISSREISKALGITTYGGFVDLDSEDPGPDEALEKAELPDLSNGPHFFYGLQWWFFGLLAVGGFFYLAYDEWRGGPGAERLRRARRDGPPGRSDSDRTQHAAVDGQHDARDER